LRLSALAEEDDVVAGQDRVLDGGQDGVVVADDAPERGLPTPQLGDEVRPELLPDGSDLVARRLQRSEGGHVGRRRGTTHLIGHDGDPLLSRPKPRVIRPGRTTVSGAQYSVSARILLGMERERLLELEDHRWR